MIRACILAILLIAASADATGLWLDGREQIASSASVVTNSSTNVTQHITNSTFDTGIQGWYDQDNGGTHIAWSASRQAIWVHPDGDPASAVPSFDYSPQIASPLPSQRVLNISYDLIRTCNVPVEIRFEDSECYITNFGYFIGTTHVEHVFSSNWCGVSTQIQFIVFQSATTNGVGDGEAGFYFDNLYFYTSSNSTSITTNSGSGASGPTLDGRVPLSTNLHTFLNGVRQ